MTPACSRCGSTTETLHCPQCRSLDVAIEPGRVVCRQCQHSGNERDWRMISMLIAKWGNALDVPGP